ncbi:hypothetical protein [Streptomyces sp. NPDC059604]|uniref:hypothetical protein n=1 Tax=Streptomyces sp. NPDC059604 TaxID=3346881 RepID=UPI0036A53CD8
MPKQDQPENEGTEAGEPEERVNFSARVRASVRRRAKVYAAANDVNLQDLMDEALDEYLKRHGG